MAYKRGLLGKFTGVASSSELGHKWTSVNTVLFGDKMKKEYNTSVKIKGAILDESLSSENGSTL
ncbi:hypothetical protein ABNX05_22350 [Lysinibacillus sp. M3]|uniref:Uncharacterized protein n=1 Tax=Lysinibacillus zambalensis TaxID=3160866 RepID=A0ABV1MXX2_9BACI